MRYAARFLLKTIAPMLLVSIFAILTYDAVAVRALLPRPTTAGVVDLMGAMDKLTAKANWDATLKGMSDKAEDEARKRGEALNTRLNEINAMEEGAAKNDAKQQALLDNLEFTAWKQGALRTIDRERSHMWQSLYRDIRNEAAQLAASEGYDLILVDDSIGDLGIRKESEMSAEQQILSQIGSRRVLHADKVIDITDKLVVRLNNARAAAGK